MLTPVELQNIPLKTGMGYKKKDVDDLLDEICKDYEQLYKENVELKDKLTVLSDGLQYYKEMEKTLQKTLVVAEKTAEEMQNTSQAKADLIREKAKAEAECIVEEARKKAQKIHNQTLSLVQQYENYRIQYKRLASAQVELLETEAYQLHFNTKTPEFLMEPVKEAAIPNSALETAMDDTKKKELEKESSGKETSTDKADLEQDFTVNMEGSFGFFEKEKEEQ